MPLVEPILHGGLAGHPHTDLYPAVAGMAWFTEHAGQVLPAFAPELAAPRGMPFVYSSPLHGWLAVVLRPLLGLPYTWLTGLALARIATVLCAHGAGRALGLTPAGALVLAAVYGCSPLFHGYAVEGIVEGTDGWALPLWVWLAARERWAGATVAAALVVMSSWYMALAGLLAALAVAPWAWRATGTYVAGLLICSPAMLVFTGATALSTPLDPAVRASMGASTELFPRPGVLPGLNPFARTSWLGWITAALALASIRRHPRWALAAAVAAILSLGVGPWYELPGWQSVRFPYRLHVLTLLAAGVLAARSVQRLAARFPARRWIAPALAAVVVVEGMLLSPVEPLVPSSPAEVPRTYHDLRGRVVLSVPGPLTRPPGEMNPSRPRARYLLYYPAMSGTRTAWAPDFNGIGAGTEVAIHDAVRSWDPHEGRDAQAVPLGALREAGIDALVVHRQELGSQRTRELLEHLESQGARTSELEEGLVVVSGW